MKLREIPPPSERCDELVKKALSVKEIDFTVDNKKCRKDLILKKNDEGYFHILYFNPAIIKIFFKNTTQAYGLEVIFEFKWDAQNFYESKIFEMKLQKYREILL